MRECWRLGRQHSAQARERITDDLEDEGARPDERVIEEHAEVRRAVQRMPMGCRRVLTLRHGRALGERAIAAILGLPLGTVQWRLKRAHDHLHGVLTRGYAPQLAATLREVTREMEIRVDTGTAESPAPRAEDGQVDFTGTIQYETVTLAEAAAILPGFRLPGAVVAEYPDLTCELGRRGRDASRDVGAPTNVSLHTAADRYRLLIEYGPPSGPASLMVQRFPGAQVGVDEDTQVGGCPGRWTEVNRLDHVRWLSKTGAGWHVCGARSDEVRRVAEAIEAGAPS